MALRICVVVLCLFSVSSWGHFDNYNEDAVSQENNIAVSPPIMPSKPCNCKCTGETIKPPATFNPCDIRVLGTSICKWRTTPAPSKPKPCGGWLYPPCPTTVSPPSPTVKITYSATTHSTKGLDAAIRAAVEFFLNQVKVSINAAASQEISLPNVELSLGVGSVKCTGGYFKGLQSISLAGEIKVTARGAGFVIDFPVELKETEIGYKYAITVLGVGPKGSFKGSLGANKFNIRLSMSVGQPCLINLEKVETVQLSGLKVHLTTGCTTCDSVINQATNVINNLLPAAIKVPLQVQISNILTKIFPGKGFACAKYLGEGSINKK